MRRTVAIISIILVCGCMCLPSSDKPQVQCNSPYIQVGRGCCLDKNENMICDKDEMPQTPPQPTTTEVTATLEATTSTLAQTTSTTHASTTSTTHTTSTSTTTATTSSSTLATLPLPCLETDSGIDPAVKGGVSKGAESGIDRCESTVKLIEFYCDHNFIFSKQIDCPKGCVNGACGGCADSDGGDNPAVFGEVKLGTILTKKDLCSKIGAGNVLQEYYCVSPTEVGMREVTCPTTCVNGRCT